VLQQTIARLDPFLTEVRDGVILSDIKYDVYDKDGGKHVMSGAWGLVDGGYHRWLTMFGPFLAFNERDALWSAWAASLRKDSEDGFGILKGIFRLSFLYLVRTVFQCTAYIYEPIFCNGLITHPRTSQVDSAFSRPPFEPATPASSTIFFAFAAFFTTFCSSTTVSKKIGMMVLSRCGRVTSAVSTTTATTLPRFSRASSRISGELIWT
jgi:hypothetical protein